MYSFEAGDSALHVAAREGLVSVAQALCAFGCAVDCANVAGETPLHLAAETGNADFVRCLCLAGCRTDAVNADGLTPEVVAAVKGHSEVRQLLARMKKVVL